MRKIIDYQVSKTFGDKSEEKKQESAEHVEILCQDQVQEIKMEFVFLNLHTFSLSLCLPPPSLPPPLSLPPFSFPLLTPTLLSLSLSPSPPLVSLSPPPPSPPPSLSLGA